MQRRWPWRGWSLPPLPTPFPLTVTAGARWILRPSLPCIHRTFWRLSYDPELQAFRAGHLNHGGLPSTSVPKLWAGLCSLLWMQGGWRQQQAPEALGSSKVSDEVSLLLVSAQCISFSIFFGTCACPDVHRMWWEPSFMKLLAEYRLVSLWF